jgi:hypothetical protein
MSSEFEEMRPEATSLYVARVVDRIPDAVEDALPDSVTTDDGVTLNLKQEEAETLAYTDKVRIHTVPATLKVHPLMSIPVELEVTPWSEHADLVGIRPLGRVRLWVVGTRRYQDAADAALAELADDLESVETEREVTTQVA